MKSYTIKQGPDGLYDIYVSIAGGGDKMVEWGYGSMNAAKYVVKQLRGKP